MVPCTATTTRTTATAAIVLLTASICGCGGQSRSVPEYDLIIENGRIVDGTGAAWFHGDMAVRGERIARIAPRGMLRSASALERVDADGLVVAPGFIDIQSRSQGNFLGGGDGRVVSKVTQGITSNEASSAGPESALEVRTFFPVRTACAGGNTVRSRISAAA